MESKPHQMDVLAKETMKERDCEAQACLMDVLAKETMEERDNEA